MKDASQYENSAAAKLVATQCAICNRPLVDAESAEAAMGPDCRARYGYNTQVPPEVRKEANTIVYEIAAGAHNGEAFVTAIQRLIEIGFEKLGKQLWFRRRRQLAPAYSASKWAASPPVPKEMAPMTDTDLSVPADNAAHVELVAPTAPDTAAPALAALPFRLTEGQDRAMDAIARTRARVEPSVCVITGYAGTGKTTMLRAVAAAYEEPIVITPTGKAALRVRQATGLGAMTIHRWLYKPKEDPRTGAIRFVKRFPDEIPMSKSRIVVLDEASMVGPDVWKDVWDTVQQLNLRLVCVGDPFQLPPVLPPKAPPFSILAPDFLAAISSERAELTEVLRQAQDNPIIRASMALRAGDGVRAFDALPQIQTSEFGTTALATLQQNGVIICHTNATRMRINHGVRSLLGYVDANAEYPREGEPLLVLKNTYEVGLLNGETTPFNGWAVAPHDFSRITDKYNPDVQESGRYGAALVGEAKLPVTLVLEELHGHLRSGQRAISLAGQGWARTNRVYLADSVAPHLHCNFGYGFTAHKAQGSQWPYVLVAIEPSVRLRNEDGRRWAYTAITRAEKMTAVYFGGV